MVHWSTIVGVHGGWRSSAVARWPSPAMAGSGEEGYSIMGP
jgi:hypothetical protein